MDLNFKNIFRKLSMMRKSKQQQSSFNIRIQKKNHGRAYVEDQVNLPMIGVAVSFKVLSIIFYFSLGYFHLIDFVLVITLCSIDFWTAKNLTGRHLCGLRWWIEQDRDSQQQSWVFESCNPDRQINKINFYVFWISQALYNAFWTIMLVMHLIVHLIIYFEIFWLCLSIVCLLLTSINTLCYFKCRGTHKQKVNQILSKMGMTSHKMIDQESLDANQQQGKPNGSNASNEENIDID